MADRHAVASRPHPHIGPQPSASHPRRRPAPESVSLKHAPTANRDATPRSQLHSASSLLNHHSTSAASSNSQAWFERSNNNPALPKTSPIDHEPPFFLPESSSGNSNSKGAPSLAQSVSLPNVGPWRREGLEAQLDDFRGVIDDLTVQNKKLTKRLRRYETASHDALSKDRLFQVTFHGLPDAKKRELEETLKRFALTLNDIQSSNGSSEVNTNPVSAPVASKPSSSLTSTKFDDSGYGSMSASNQPSAHRFSSNLATRNHPTGLEASRARDRNIHSYLHDIPEGLRPQDSPAVMTDEARKRLVVARLEQLFQGSGAALDGHSQPLQQQEVSQLAATADRKEQEARGQRAMVEGTREARIMEHGPEAPVPHAPKKPTDQDADPSASYAPEVSVTSEQRPTRPLDLDPHRAQDAGENVDYIRHLGFFVPDPSPAMIGESNQGWVYLNLLINMAQLHTLNVSTSLVRDALRSYSTKFELSGDGRKIRWHPNAASTLHDRSGLDDGASADSSNLRNARSGHSERNMRGRKRSHSQYLDYSSTSNSSAVRKSKLQSMSGEISSKMSFTPHPTRSDNRNTESDGEDWRLEQESEGYLPSVAEYPDDSPLNAQERMDTTISQSSSSHGDGALVFYNNPQFFLDMSGSRYTDEPTMKQMRYRIANTQPLGSVPPMLKPESSDKKPYASPLPPLSVSGSLEVNTDSSDSGNRLEVDDSASAQVDSDGTPIPISFEASGIGYVYPSDNFVLYVHREHGPTTRFSTLENTPPEATRSKPIEQPPEKRPRVVSVRHRKLQPSELPPATFAVSPDEETGGSISDEEDDAANEMDIDVTLSSDEDLSETSGSEEPDEDGQFDSGSSSDERIASSKPSEEQSQRSSKPKKPGISRQASSYEDQDNQSVDFLATAREIDPATIRAREREYDAELAERLAEEIPAGSSAATRGGGCGSGFNTPARAHHANWIAKAHEAAEQDIVDEDIDSNAQERSVSS